MPGAEATRRFQDLDRLVVHGEQPFRRREQGPADLAEFDPPTLTMEKFDAELALEVADLLGDGWLAQVEAFRRVGEAALEGDSPK